MTDLPKPTAPEYRPWYVPGKGGLWQCLRCGAIVGDKDLHTEWHMDLTSAIHNILDNVLPLLFAVAGDADE